MSRSITRQKPKTAYFKDFEGVRVWQELYQEKELGLSISSLQQMETENQVNSPVTSYTELANSEELLDLGRYLDHESTKDNQSLGIVQGSCFSQNSQSQQQSQNQPLSIVQNNMEEEQLEPIDAYMLGHVQYMSNLKTPIFGQSRYFQRTKKRSSNHQTYFSTIAKVLCQSGKNQKAKNQYAKRFDQGQQDKFKNGDDFCQKRANLTYQALQHLSNNRHIEKFNQIIKKMKGSYSKKRLSALLLKAHFEEKDEE